MSAPTSTALSELQGLIAEADALRFALMDLQAVALDAFKLPPMPVVAPPARSPRVALDPSLTAEQVARAWSLDGARWVASLDRRGLATAVARLRETVDGRALLDQADLVNALLDAAEARLRPYPTRCGSADISRRISKNP